MNDLRYSIEDNKLFEAIADVAYLAGQKGFSSGDSRCDVAQFIEWAKEFEAVHEDTNWDEQDYCDTIDAFTTAKLKVELK